MHYANITVRDVVLTSFPPNDEAFGTLARQLLAKTPGMTPEALEAGLRDVYPRVTVRARDELVNFGRERVWYAYRDGRYSPFGGDAWWEAATAPTVVIADGRYLEANDEALALFGADRDAFLASRPGDFTSPAHRALVPWLFQLLQDTGELHSVSVLQPRHGPAVPVEYHMRLDATTGRIQSAFRVVPADAVEVDPPKPG